MQIHRYLIAATAGVVTFTLVTAACFNGLCSFGFGGCSGSAFQLWMLLLLCAGALAIFLISLAMEAVLRRAITYRTWYLVPICGAVAVVAPKIYVVATGSTVHALRTFSVVDGTFAFAGLLMGLVVILLWPRPNNSFKPKPLRGSA